MLVDYEQKHQTVEDLASLPDDGKQYELIAGEIIMVPSPSANHQDISQFLSETLGPIVRKQKLGKLYCAPLDVWIDSENVFQPDVILILRENLSIIESNGIHGAPDLVIEILSPSNGYYDLKTKKDTYQRIGVSEYWIVDPMDRSIECFTNTDRGYETFFLGKTGVVASQLVPEFSFEVSTAFDL